MGLVWSPFTSREDWILGYITLLGENIIISFRVLLNLPLEYCFEIPAVRNECWETIRKSLESYWDCQWFSTYPDGERMEKKSSQNATGQNGHKLWMERFSLEIRESILQLRKCNPLYYLQLPCCSIKYSPASGRRVDWVVSRNVFQTRCLWFKRLIGSQFVHYWKVIVWLLWLIIYPLCECTSLQNASSPKISKKMPNTEGNARHSHGNKSKSKISAL